MSILLSLHERRYIRQVVTSSLSTRLHMNALSDSILVLRVGGGCLYKAVMQLNSVAMAVPVSLYNGLCTIQYANHTTLRTSCLTPS